MKAPFLLLLLSHAEPSAAIEALIADGNPHDNAAPMTATCCPAQALPPTALLADAALLRLQTDTFVGKRTRRHYGHPVEVFTFKQPQRLSSRELGFDLALVDAAGVDPTGTVEVPALPAEAADSWFPDYAWSHYVVCVAAGGDAPKHLGWRFSRKGSATGFGPESFVAMIVRAEREEEKLAGAVQDSEPLSVAVAVSSGGAYDEHAVHNADALAEVEDKVETMVPLPVGIDAPGWLVKMMVAITARSVPSSS